jgi:DNA-directed RNA polymerase specialized sigma24 family protein
MPAPASSTTATPTNSRHRAAGVSRSGRLARSTAVPLPPFQRFLDEHRDAVWRFLVALVGRQEADDCFQDTFLSALRAYPRLSDAADLKAWVLTIAHRKAIDSQRARTRRPVPVAEPDPGPAPDGPRGPEPELWERVRRLPPKQRAAVALRFVADLPHADAARVMGCSEAAARRNLHAALTRLRKEWR